MDKEVKKMVSCKICNGQFDTSPDSIVLCEHKEGVIHFGCCVNKCSQDGQACKHALGVYNKIKKEE